MYNESRKELYIREYSSNIKTQNALATAFNAIEPYEVEYGKDLCAFNAHELTESLPKVSGVRYITHVERLGLYRRYVRWCIANQFPDACDSIEHYQADNHEKLRQRFISGPAHLQHVLNAMFLSEDENTMDNVYRAFFWLTFSGMYPDDILRVRRDEVNLARMTVEFAGDEYPIYRESIIALEKCKTRDTFFVIRERPGRQPQKILMQRFEPTLLICGVRAMPGMREITQRISNKSRAARQQGKTDMQLTPQRAWLSGLFYRAFELERFGIAPDFYSTVVRYISHKGNLDVEDRQVKKYMKECANSYMHDYEIWKALF